MANFKEKARVGGPGLFYSTITFPPQTSGSVGTLVFNKDNPSGLPANDDSRTISIIF